MSEAGERSAGRQVLPFAALSATYFAHIGFFNPYLPLWLQSLGLPIVVISLLTAVQSFTRLFAPYAWGLLSDRTGERVRLLRYSAIAALVSSLGLWWNGGVWWLGAVLLVLFLHTSSMMSLTEAAMSQLVDGDWGRYGRIRLWGSAGFLVTVFLAGGWFEWFGMGHFPAWTVLTLAAVMACTYVLPNVTEARPAGAHAPSPPVGPVLRKPGMVWFFASVACHVMAHFAIYAFLSLYLDARGYSKGVIGLLWAVSVIVEVAWFYGQGRWMHKLRLADWLWVSGLITFIRMAMTAGASDSLGVLLVAQCLHAVTFAAHHTACIAWITHHFPGRLRGRGQALLTVTGYGIGGVAGVVSGGALVTALGYQVLFEVAAALGLLATACAWMARRADHPGG
jgi:PPP family 3-phenylpropionic acid transporter